MTHNQLPNWYFNALCHHGIIGQKWGVRRSPEELRKRFGPNVHFKVPEMSKEDRDYAMRLWDRIPEARNIPNKNRAMSEINSNLSPEDEVSPVIHKDYGNYNYTVINRGDNDLDGGRLKIINYNRISDSGYDDFEDYVFSESVGPDWRKYDY